MVHDVKMMYVQITLSFSVLGVRALVVGKMFSTFRPRARDGLSVSLVQDLADIALVTKLDSYVLFNTECIYCVSGLGLCLIPAML